MITSSVHNQQKYIVPDFTVEHKGFFNAVATIENRFLQSFADLGAIVILDKGDGFTVFGYKSLLYMKVIDANTINLECIATPQDDRGQGSGTSAMRSIVAVADKTNTKVVLRTANVNWSKNNYMAPPLPIAHGSTKKGKIPTAMLSKWYEKFGFVKVKKNGSGWDMEYIPKQPDSQPI